MGLRPHRDTSPAARLACPTASLRMIKVVYEDLVFSRHLFYFCNCSGSEMRPREFSGSRGGGWRQVGHEGLADDQLMTGVQKVVALFAAGGEIAANAGEGLRPGQRAKAA